MLDRHTFWTLYAAMDLHARPGHVCLDHDHCYVDCPYTESVQSIRQAANELLTVLQEAQAQPARG